MPPHGVGLEGARLGKNREAKNSPPQAWRAPARQPRDSPEGSASWSKPTGIDPAPKDQVQIHVQCLVEAHARNSFSFNQLRGHGPRHPMGIQFLVGTIQLSIAQNELKLQT